MCIWLHLGMHLGKASVQGKELSKQEDSLTSLLAFDLGRCFPLLQDLANSGAECVGISSAVASCHQSLVLFFAILNNFKCTEQQYSKDDNNFLGSPLLSKRTVLQVITAAFQLQVSQTCSVESLLSGSPPSRTLLAIFFYEAELAYCHCKHKISLTWLKD